MYCLDHFPAHYIDPDSSINIQTGDYLAAWSARAMGRWASRQQQHAITEYGNHRVIEVNTTGAIVWQYGTTGTSGSGYDLLYNPMDAERLPINNFWIVAMKLSTLYTTKNYMKNYTNCGPNKS